MTAYHGTYSLTQSSDPGATIAYSVTASGTVTLPDLLVSAYNDLSSTYTATFDGTLTRRIQRPGEAEEVTVEPLTSSSGNYSSANSPLRLPLPLNFLMNSGFNPVGTMLADAARSTLDITEAGRFSTAYGPDVFDGTMTIHAELAATTTAFGIAPAAALEGQAGQNPIVFTLTRVGSLAGAASVPFGFVASGANPYYDGIQAPFNPDGRVHFADGQASQTLTLTVIGDIYTEADHTFTVTLARAEGEYMTPQTSAVGTVLNDDAAVQFVLQERTGGYADNEGTGPFRYTQSIGLSQFGPYTGVAYDLDWRVTGIGPRPADAADFEGGVLPSGRIHVPANAANFFITIPVQPDALVEPDEGFRIEIASPQPEVGIPYRFMDSAILTDDPIADLAARTAVGGEIATLPGFYGGPVAGLEKEFIDLSGADLLVAVAGPNWFLRSGAGNDALAAASGVNVLDGGTGSNFLTGGSGDDTFFVDARGATAATWSTLAGFAGGDSATLWGIAADTHALVWAGGQGAPGFAGLSLHATAPGAPTASLTLPGYTPADLENNRLVVLFGTEPISGSAYMFVHALP